MSLFKRISRLFDRRLLLLILGFYGVFSLFALLKMIYFKSIGERFTNNTWSYMFFGVYLTDFILVIIFMSLALLVTKYMIIHKWSWLKNIALHLILSVGLGIFIFIGLVLVQKLFGLHEVENITFNTVFYYYMNVIDLNFLVYFSLVGIMHTYYYVNEVKNAEAQRADLAIRLLKTKLTTLQLQLNPHFIFNSLNSVSALIYSNVEKAHESLINLSDFLREMLKFKDENTISLGKEQEILDKYIGIMQLRFQDRFTVNIDIPEDTRDIQVPSLILQPLIENSIKHGYSKNRAQLQMQISAVKEKNQLLLRITNNGKPLQEGFNLKISAGVGIRNILNRLDILYPGQYQFTFKNRTEGVETTIMLPLG